MTVLLAHHLEVHHVPILLCFFAVGFWVGWRLLSSRLEKSRVSEQLPQ